MGRRDRGWKAGWRLEGWREGGWRTETEGWGDVGRAPGGQRLRLKDRGMKGHRRDLGHSGVEIEVGGKEDHGWGH